MEGDVVEAPVAFAAVVGDGGEGVGAGTELGIGILILLRHRILVVSGVADGHLRLDGRAKGALELDEIAAGGGAGRDVADRDVIGADVWQGREGGLNVGSHGGVIRVVCDRTRGLPVEGESEAACVIQQDGLLIGQNDVVGIDHPDGEVGIIVRSGDAGEVEGDGDDCAERAVAVEVVIALGEQRNLAAEAVPRTAAVERILQLGVLLAGVSGEPVERNVNVLVARGGDGEFGALSVLRDEVAPPVGRRAGGGDLIALATADAPGVFGESVVDDCGAGISHVLIVHHARRAGTGGRVIGVIRQIHSQGRGRAADVQRIIRACRDGTRVGDGSRGGRQGRHRVEVPGGEDAFSGQHSHGHIVSRG